MIASGRREIGLARRRVEDPRLVQGAGQYVDDFRLPGTLEAAFVRSTYAHAKIRSVNLDAARRAPGVVAVWSGADVASWPRLPNRMAIKPLNLSPLPPLAFDRVTQVGYPVAVVVAEDRYAARDAADLIEVEYEPLPVVTSAESAMEADAPLLFPEFGTNVAYHIVKEGGDVDGAFASAERTLSIRLVHGRLSQMPMEPRGILASLDREKDFLTVWRSTQNAFLTRNMLSAVLGRGEDSIRVIAPDVGGAFGSKSAVYPDELTVVLLANELGVPVRWVSTRMEDFQFTLQGRDQVNLVDVAFTNDGLLQGLKVRTIYNLGGCALHPIAAPPLRVLDFAIGAYRTAACRVEAFGVYTNTNATGPYRGAGRPEAAFIAERSIEAVARAISQDPLEVRRRNFITPDQFPYKSPLGPTYDSGDYEKAVARAKEIMGYDRLRAEIEAERQRNNPGAPLRGLGVATTIEVSGQGFEFGQIDVESDGSIVARTGSSSHGQGHETSFAQIVAERLGVPFESIRVLHGDTAETPIGGGTGGSRSLVVGGGALASVSEGIKKKAISVAAALFESSAEDLVYRDGGVEVVGAPERRLELAEIAKAAQEGVGLPDGEIGLTDQERFQAAQDAIPFGAALALVSIDRETGKVTLDRMVVVDDIGVVVNPLIVDGQVAGGLAQGIGEALYEHVVYDEEGQLQTASLLDYAVPTAHMLPDYELDLVETPAPNSPTGAKGVGESGCVSGPPAVVNAVLDALSPLGITNMEMPLTSERVWKAMRAALSKR